MTPGVHESPMFPLGSVLFPEVVIRLHVFEERYRRMVDDVLGGSRTFGVVLIERGSEVGGGDVRADVGCLAHVLDAERSPDGRWALAVQGVERIRVARWLPDDPYPRAEIAVMADDEAEGIDAQSELVADVAALAAQFRTVCALATEARVAAPPIDVDLGTDAPVALMRMSALGPFGAFDRQRLLASTSTARRRELLSGLLDDLEAVLRDRLSSGDS
jgi:Lon protease-like protein